jgi:ketosteroid isomerase-like protein
MVVEDTTAARGPEAMRQNLDRIADAFDLVTFEPLEFVHRGDLVAIRVGVTARGASTGLELDAEVGQLWTLRDGQAIGLDIFPTWAEARSAAGLD